MQEIYILEDYAAYEMFNKLKIRRKYFADFLERNGEVSLYSLVAGRNLLLTFMK